MSRFFIVPCVLAALSSLPGCAEDDAVVEVGVGTTSQALALAEAPEQAVEPPAGGGGGAAASAARHVRVTVKEIRVHIAGDADETEEGAGRGAPAERGPGAADARPEGAGWTTVFSGRKTIDLSDDTALASVLGSANARPGRLTQVRLVLDGAAELVENGQSSALACPSCEVSGLKIIQPGGERLDGGRRHRFLLALDVSASIVDEGGQLRLRPVMRLDRSK